MIKVLRMFCWLVFILIISIEIVNVKSPLKGAAFKCIIKQDKKSKEELVFNDEKTCKVSYENLNDEYLIYTDDMLKYFINNCIKRIKYEKHANICFSYELCNCKYNYLEIYTSVIKYGDIYIIKSIMVNKHTGSVLNYKKLQIKDNYIEYSNR